MNKYLIVGLLVAAVAAGAVGAYLMRTPQLGGDFAGGIVPTNLWTGSAATNSVTPVTSNVLVPGAISVGGVAAANQIPVVYTATTSYPASAFNLGGITATTSTTSTALSMTASGFSIGDACEISYNGATTTSAFGADGFVTAVSGNAVTATVTFWNGSASAITFSVTSTATGVSSTLKATCFHTGV